MFSTFGGLWSTLIEHPFIGFIAFVAVSAGVIFVMSGGKLSEAAGGIFRVFSTIFTTPFAFLRDALTIIRRSGDAEKDYAHTTMFVLFRYSRILYLAILTICLITLSGGITASLISLYPQAEIQQSAMLSQQTKQLKDELKAAKEAVAAASSPAQRQALETTRTKAQKALEAQTQSNAAFKQTNTFQAPIIDRIAEASNEDYLAQVTNNIGVYIADCPYGYSWQGFSPEDCTKLSAFAVELARRKSAELKLSQAFAEADQAWQRVDSAATEAQTRLTNTQEYLKQAQSQEWSVSLFNPSWIFGHLGGALMILLSTFGLVIVIVWSGAILIDVLNWVILMMRSLEITQSKHLPHAASDAPIEDAPAES